MGKRDLPIKDIIFYGAVTAVFMVTSAFGALEGWFGSGLTGFDGGPRPSDWGYVALAAFYGSLCGVGSSTPFLLVFLALGLRSVPSRRISTIWLVGNVSASLFAALLMFLTNTLSRLPEDFPIISFVILAAAPPGLLGLRLITHIARYE